MVNLPDSIVGQAELESSFPQLARPRAAVLPRIIAKRVKRDLVVIMRFLSRERLGIKSQN